MEIVRIPRNLILNKDLGDKRVLAFSSILFSGWDGSDIAHLVQYSGYGVDRVRGGTNSQFKELVNQFISERYLQTSTSVSHTGHEFVSRYFDFFATITFQEFQKILAYRKQCADCGKRINHAHLLLLLAHIRCHMFRDSIIPRMYSNLYVRISQSIGISVRSISGCVKILEQLEILHCEELPRYKDHNGQWHSNVKVFVDRLVNEPQDYDYQKETERAISYVLSCQTN